LVSRINSFRDRLGNYIKEWDTKWSENLLKFEDKVTYAELDRVKSMLEKFASIQQVKDLRSEVIPEIKGLKSLVKEFTEDNINMREMIRRFDEIISEKASKMAVHELEIFVENQYVKKRYWDKL
jgi:hypothetical protein